MHQSPFFHPALSSRVLNRLANAAMLFAILLGLPMVSALAAGTPPSLSVSDTSTYSVGGSAVVVAPNLTITDDDNENIDGARVAITTNFSSSTDRLGISGQGTATSGAVTPLAWSYDAGTGVLTFSGTSNVSTYEAALRQVTFYSTGSPAANARTVQFSLGSSLANPDNGHFYEFISSSGIRWDTARDAAAAQFLFGLQGYLATATSASESSFISGKVSGNGWIGASDAAVEGNWSWVTGPEAGVQFWAGAAAGSAVGGQYNNWDPGFEPNNSGDEDYAHIIGNPALGVNKLGRWNDLPISIASGSYAPLGYLIEYGGSAGDPVLTITGDATVNVVYAPAINTVSPSSGPTASGTSVTIAGSNLSGATSVTFGGVVVPITSNSSTAIIVTVPAHAAGQVDVVVTTGTGTAIQTNGYVYIDAPTISAPAAGSYLTNTSVNFAGTASPGSTVTVKESGATLCSVVADVGGAWTCNPTLSQGAHTVSVTSAIGSATTGPVTRSFTVDSLAPAAPAVNSPVNASATNDTTPSFGGTAEPGSKVNVSVDGALVCTNIVADGSGNWSCTSSATLSQASHIVSATATDDAGNVGPASANKSFTVDTTAPGAPVVTSPVDGSMTNDTTPAFSGTAEAGSLVTVKNGATTLCTATANGSGAWSCSSGPVLAAGNYNLSATATDAAGNVGPASADQSFTVDTTAPGAPVVTSPVDGSATNDTTPAFSGTAEAGSLVTVKNGATTLCTATANGSGAWSCSSGPVLAAGNYNLSATATDATGNTSTGATLALEVDVTPPAAPLIGSANVTGDVTPTFFGTAEPGSTVSVTVDGVAYCTAVTNGTGNWTCAAGAALSPGAHAVSAIATDPASNASSPTTQALTIDTTQPDSATISSPAIMSDNTPVFAGTAEPNGTVKVSVDGVLYCTTTANGAGNWTCTAATVLSEGSHAVSAVVTDAANNTSPPATQALLIDTAAPAALIITSPSSVNDTTPTFAGTAEPGSAITVQVDGVTVCTDIVSASGAWSCRPTTPLTTGSHNVSVTATDAANNVSPATTQTLIVDTTAPSAPTISMPIAGASVRDTPAFAGTAEPGSTVTVAEGAITLCTATVDGAGNWSCTPATPLDEGSHTISITVTDPAGNTSLAAEIPIGVDITVPSAPLITSRSNTLDSKPLLQGTAEPGSIVTVVFDPDNNPATNNSVTYVTTASLSGIWSIDTGSATPTSGTFPTDGLAVGTRADVQVVARDAAGNISDVTNQLLFVGTQLYWPLLRAS